MHTDHLLPRTKDLSPGLYSVRVTDVSRVYGFTVVSFVVIDDGTDLIKPLIGRAVHAWFETGSTNGFTVSEAESQFGYLKEACGLDDLPVGESDPGVVLGVRVEHVIDRSDPSRYRAEAVEFFPYVFDPS